MYPRPTPRAQHLPLVRAWRRNLMVAYPALRPAETIRALIVHSADWTATMRISTFRSSSPEQVRLREPDPHCGWGVPESGACALERGQLFDAGRRGVHPFKKVTESGVVSRDMNLHALPWPQGATGSPGHQVELCITLSYFTSEPNPLSAGASSKFHYPSSPALMSSVPRCDDRRLRRANQRGG